MSTPLELIEQLAERYGEPADPPTRDAFELVLYENVAYLAPDDRRRQAFALLRDTIGTRPEQILAASEGALEAVGSKGILKGTSAEKLRRCASLALELFDGNTGRLSEVPVARAKAWLRRFPGIGEPGAEKILLFALDQPFLAAESNALRVLMRLGLVEESHSYAATYRESRALASSFGDTAPALRRAHGLLRLHGRTTCRDRRPACDDCPLRRSCPWPERSGSDRDSSSFQPA